MLQFPDPHPPNIPEYVPSQAEQFLVCLFLVAVSTALISFFLPRPFFRKLFKIAFPFMPERLEDSDEK